MMAQAIEFWICQRRLISVTRSEWQKIAIIKSWTNKRNGNGKDGGEFDGAQATTYGGDRDYGSDKHWKGIRSIWKKDGGVKYLIENRFSASSSLIYSQLFLLIYSGCHELSNSYPYTIFFLISLTQRASKTSKNVVNVKQLRTK